MWNSEWQRNGKVHFYGQYKLRYQRNAARWVIGKQEGQTYIDTWTAPTFMEAKAWVETTQTLGAAP